MPKHELYIHRQQGRKPDTISLSKEFFDSADIDIEVKAKVIYESDKDNIINEYIVFCKVFNEQIMRTYEKDLKRETLMENAKHMLKMGKVTVKEIPDCYPDLTMDDAKEIEEEVMQLA